MVQKAGDQGRVRVEIFGVPVGTFGASEAVRRWATKLNGGDVVVEVPAVGTRGGPSVRLVVAYV
jgi:hypothetical protein